MSRPAPTLAALSLLAVWAAPAELRAESGAQVWGAIFSQADLSDQVPRLQLWLDLHSRYGGTGLTTLVRPGVGLSLVDGLILHVGYAWIARVPEEESAVHEHRLWEQLLFTHRFAERLDVLLRARLEQRFPGAGGELGHRFRFMLRGTWWLAAEGPLALVGWDEIFLGLASTDWGGTSGFDQNRLFAGLAIRGPLRTRFELGYLNLFLRRPSVEDRMDHVASFNLFVSL